MKYSAGIVAIALLFVVVTVLIAVSPDAAFWTLFAALALAAPFVVVAGAVRWLVKQCKGGRHAR